MRLSRYKSNETQGTLWDECLGNHGHVRTVVGNLAEILTSEFVRGKRHRTQSDADYCPDVSKLIARKVVYFESKSVGKSKQAFVYAGRLEKDRKFATWHNLTYAIWHHLAESKTVDTVGKLEELVLSHMRALYLVPFSALDAICSHLKEEKLNSAYGRNREIGQVHVYGSRYRINLSSLPSPLFTWPAGIVQSRAEWDTLHPVSDRDLLRLIGMG